MALQPTVGLTPKQRNAAAAAEAEARQSPTKSSRDITLGPPPPGQADFREAQRELDEMRSRYNGAKLAWQGERSTLKQVAAERAARVDALEAEKLELRNYYQERERVLQDARGR